MSGVSIHDGAAWVTVIMNVGLPLLHAGRLLRAVHFDTLRRTPLQSISAHFAAAASNRSPLAASCHRSINIFVRSDVDEQQCFRFGLGMFLLGEDNPAVIANRTGMESFQMAAQMVRLQAGIIGILSQASQSHLNLRLQRGVFSNHAAERPFKAWC
jgi:hypothetical protein